MARTVADELVDRLIDGGVQRIYGVVGDSLNPVTDAVRRTKGKINWVHVRHEEAGAFAASAEAQLSGKLTACAGSCGPGNLHLINGLYDAHRSSAPVIAIASHIPTIEIGTEYFQETHPERLFQECSHYCELIATPRQMPRMLQIAMQKAVGKGGVSVLVVPGDVAGMDIPSGSVPPSPVSARPVVRPCDGDLAKLADMVNAAEKITLLCGYGCRDAHAEILQFAEKVKAPVGHAYRGKQYLEYDNPYDVGMTGLLGFGSAFNAMHECDLLLLLGTDFPYPQFLPDNPKVAQVDIRADHLGRRCKLDLGLCGDIGETLRAILPRISGKTDRTHLDRMLSEHKESIRKLGVYIDHVGTRRPIHPELVAAALNEAASEDAIFTVDTGMCNVWHARYIRATRNRRMLASYMHGSMANALPHAIGAQMLYPDRQVVSMSGDGGFAMLLGDLLTVLQYKLPIKIVLFNNGALGMVKLEMEVAGLPDWQTGLVNPNFAKMAEAMGFKGIRIEDPAGVRSGMQEAFAHTGPVLIDAVTDPNALSMPPHVTLGQLEGFSLAMGKLILSGHIDEVVDTIEANVRNL
jgi:pyruvate dehydrogenase (quinone)